MCNQIKHVITLNSECVSQKLKKFGPKNFNSGLLPELGGIDFASKFPTYKIM